LEHMKLLDSEEPWSSDAITILQESLAEDKNLEEKLAENFSAFEEYFEIKAHMAFCLAVKLQSRLKKEKDFFILRELLRLEKEEVAELLVEDYLETKSKEIWEDLAEEYQEKCSLIKKTNPCTQCQDLCAWLQGVEIVEKQIKNLPFDPEFEAEENLSERLDYLEGFNVEKALSRRFHSILGRYLRHQLGKSGIEEA
ncbi:MAG: hypothetical protein KDK66_03135, partial [Deltaproteobacteria bacterium]|nr:hypothetical protein [Deltaproteobacteria bacterium]